MTNSLLAKCIASALITFAGLGPLAHAQSNPAEMRALPGVDFDAFTNGFNTGAGQPASDTAFVDLQLRRAFDQGLTLQDAFRGVLELQSRLSFTSASDYMKFAETIFRLREEIRLRNVGTAVAPTNQLQRRRELMLLQYLAEEALFVGSQRHKDMPSEFRIDYERELVADVNGGQSATIRGIRVQSGYFVTLKHSRPVSALIGAIGEVSGPFSHSFPMQVVNGQILAPEASLESGVSLSRAGQNYDRDSGVHRFVVMRPHSPNAGRLTSLLERSRNGINGLMNHLQAEGGLIKYDLRFNVIDQGVMSCAETTWDMLNRGGIMPRLTASNAYSNLNSRFSPDAQRFFATMLDAKVPRFIAPSDFEISSAFKTVGFQINVRALLSERADGAVMDAFMRNIETNESRLNEASANLYGKADDPMTKEQLEFLRKMGAPAQLINGLSSFVGRNMSLKQALLFGFIQVGYGYNVRAALDEYIAKVQAEGRLPGQVELRAVALKAGKVAMDRFAQLLTGLGEATLRPEIAPLFENRVNNVVRTCSDLFR